MDPLALAQEVAGLALKVEELEEQNRTLALALSRLAIATGHADAIKPDDGVKSSLSGVHWK